MARSGPDRWCLPAAALATLVLVDVLRVWLPSVLFVVGEAGNTPAPVMGAFALACLATGFVPALLLGRVSARAWWLTGVAVLVLGRAAIQLADGGAPQAVTSTAAVIGGVIALTALAMGAGSGSRARVGVLAGLAAAVTMHAAFGTYDLAWRGGVGPVLAVLLLVVPTAVAALQFAAEPGWDEPGSDPAWPWLVVAPTLLLVGILAGVPGRALLASGWSTGAVAGAIVAAHGLAVAIAAAGPRLPPGPTGGAGAALVAVGTAIALRPAGGLALAAQLGLAVGLGAVIAATGAAGGSSTPRRRAVTTASAVLLFGVAVFLYYAAYDLILPFSNRAVLLVMGGAAALLGLAAAFLVLHASADDGREPDSPGAVVAATVLVAALAWVATPGAATIAAAPGAPGEPIRVMLYNLQMGYDTDGRFALDRQAEVIAAQEPDIVVLNEVDRGWLVTGGHDTLMLLADRLELPYVFAPAADEVWGNALLSRYPVAELQTERLPRGSGPMQRSQFAAILDVAEGQQLAVVGTHLSHVDDRGDTRLPQARAVASMVVSLRDRGLPTVVMGDLNAELDSPELGAFQDFVTTAVGPPAATWPSTDPASHIDHILISGDLLASDASIPDTTASDHRPVVATLEFAPG